LKILAGEQWKEGYVDYACGPGSVRIAPLRWLNVTEVRSQYFAPEKSLRLVWNYIREVGLAATLRKIRSRSAEAASRNKKIVSVGIGRVLEVAGDLSGYQLGEIVGFIAANHPECVERVVIPVQLLFAVPGIPDNSSVAHIGLSGDESSDVRMLGQLGSWSELSGNTLPANMEQVVAAAQRLLGSADWSKANEYPVSVVVSTRHEAVRKTGGSDRKSAVLFGYGNYAKTIALPNLSAHLDVQTIHEIDPAQMPRPLTSDTTWDSRFWADDTDDFDVYLIAGYHHTHAAIAEHALARGSYAVVEKPIVTSFEQLANVKAALELTTAGLYAGFHKRFARYNDWIIEDLNVEQGSPLNMHAIVFEMPLPKLHWYRWKNSCSRIVSNGSHWTDHFLFMNGFSPVIDKDVYIASDETVNVSVLLENGAMLTMVLSDKGSRRLGVQNNVEFRNEAGAVRVLNDGGYFSESHDRILRKRNINRLETYNRMYQTIAQRISEGDKGDSLESFVSSAGLILEIEEIAQAKLR
jgi:predicted dehydrogenase